MPARLLQRIQARAAFRGTVPLAHPECPIEQRVRATDPHARSELLREAWRAHPPPGEGAMALPDADGLRLLARNEGALRPFADALRTCFRDGIVVERPAVRYARGAQLLEPWMALRSSGPPSHLPLIQRDLARRRARVTRVADHGGRFALEAEAPLANLLGYADWLDDRLEGAADLSMWLSRWVPVVVDEGPEAA